MSQRIRKPLFPNLDSGSANGKTAVGKWKTSDDTYSVEKFYTRATDARGHADRVSIKVPPEMLAECERLIHSGRIPEYQTPQDIFRDAVVHRLRWLADNRSIEISPLGRLLQFRAELEQIKQRQQSRAGIMASIEHIAHSATPEEMGLLEEQIAEHLAAVDSEDRDAILSDLGQSSQSIIRDLVRRIRDKFRI